MVSFHKFVKTPQMKNIVVATDFSPIALNAVHYALQLSIAYGGELIIVNTYQLPISYTEVPLVTVSLEEIKKVSEEGLLELKKNLEKLSGKKIKINTISKLGDIAEVLMEIEEEYNITLMIAGTKGVSGLERFWLGSNTLRMIEKTTTPIMTIPPGIKYQKIDKVVLATDLLDVEETTDAEKIKNLITLFNSKLSVINVDHNKRHFTAQTPEETIKLDEMLHPMVHDFVFIENESVTEGINRYVEENQIDVIFMMPRVHSMLEKIMEKSKSREMVYHSKFPIIHFKKTS